jgi:class 3 adenylate cyclase/tetratricopeptide (TPR) repeat protein
VARSPAAERRHVTVLFSDLVGFTSISQQRDAEDVRELLTRYFDTASTVIARYGGMVEKFIGDAVMAVWGIPAIQEDDAERGVRAALDLVDAVAAFGEAVGAPGLQARVGVLTGEAAVNLDASGQAMVAGDLVNTASRVQSAAAPGSVLVGEATRQATEAAIVYDDTGMHEVKGKGEPLRLWRANRVVAARGGLMRPTGIEPPFVGRDRELRLLKEMLHATGEDGKARLLSVVGVAGVGKSRLSWEFEKYVDGLTQSVYWHRGRCLAYGEGIAYWALAEMVRTRAGMLESEPLEAARAKLRRTVDEFIVDVEERRWVEPRLAQLLGLDSEPSSEPRDLFAAWRMFFERLAADQLTVLVFEDLQWADSGLLDFIEYLLEWSRNSPILVLTLARPEVAERRPGWGIGKRGLTSLYLEPLSGDAMAALLSGMVPGLSEELRVRILERAAGIPLYAVETVRMLLDRGLVVEEDGAYRANGSLDSLEVPESLHAMIAARLDGLQPSERHLLQDAAVLGKSFTPAALSSVSGRPMQSVEASLATLVEKDLLSIQSDPRSPERGQYVFVQDLVRGVAQGTLARKDRRSRHLAAADYLEASWTGEEGVAEVIAVHLVAAYEAEPTAVDATALRDRALRALVRAGDHAGSLGALDSSQRYYERALELTEDDRTRAEMSAKAAQAAKMQGRDVQAKEHFITAHRLHDLLGDTAATARALGGIAGIELAEGKADSAIKRMEAALTMLMGADESEPDRNAALADAAARLAATEYFHGDLDSALEHADLALQIAETSRLLEVVTTALDTKSWILAARGRREESEILDEGALKLARAIGLSRVGTIESNLADTLQEADRLETAAQHFEQAAVAARRAGDRLSAAFADLAGAPTLLDLGRWDRCAEIIDHYFEHDAADLGGHVPTVGYAVSAAWLFLWRGHLEGARRLVADADALFERAGAESNVPADLRALLEAARAGLANAEARHGEALDAAQKGLAMSIASYPTMARRALSEAVEAAFALGRNAEVEELIGLASRHFPAGIQPSVDAHTLRWKARLIDRVDENDSGALLRKAVDAFERLGRPFWLAVTQAELGEWLITRGRDDDARAALEQARVGFTELGAEPWLGRVDAALHRGLPIVGRALGAS